MSSVEFFIFESWGFPAAKRSCSTGTALALFLSKPISEFLAASGSPWELIDAPKTLQDGSKGRARGPKTLQDDPGPEKNQAKNQSPNGPLGCSIGPFDFGAFLLDGFWMDSGSVFDGFLVDFPTCLRAFLRFQEAPGGFQDHPKSMFHHCEASAASEASGAS